MSPIPSIAYPLPFIGKSSFIGISKFVATVIITSEPKTNTTPYIIKLTNTKIMSLILLLFYLKCVCCSFCELIDVSDPPNLISFNWIDTKTESNDIIQEPMLFHYVSVYYKSSGDTASYLETTIRLEKAYKPQINYRSDEMWLTYDNKWLYR